MSKYDTLFLCDHILLHQDGLPIIKREQALAVKEGRIAYIGPLLKKMKDQAEKTHLLKNHLVAPGFVNTHTHLPMSLFRGLADNLPLKTWLEDYIFPLEGAVLNEDFIKTGCALSLIELIQSGVTTVCDMYFYNQALGGALEESGLRGIVGLGVPSPEKGPWQKKIQALEERFKGSARIFPALAPHSPYTLKPQDLKAVGQWAQDQKLPLIIHAAESLWERDEIQKKYGQSPIRFLHDLGLTGRRSLFVHCVYANERDLEIMAQTRTSFSYNPSSNMKLGNGMAPIKTALDKGVAVGLGTDGSASNNNLNFFKEMAVGAKLQALKEGDRSLTARQMVNMATLEGAKALGLDHEIGSLEEGKKADIMAIDLSQTAFQPLYDPLSSMVYSALGHEVSFVMCEGKTLMENRELKTLNQEKIFYEAKGFAAQAQDFLKKLKS